MGSINLTSINAATSNPYTISTNSSGTGGWLGLSNNLDLDTSKTLHVKGDTHIEGELKVKGDIMVGEHSIGDRLSTIEKRLGILYPNRELESRWEELRNLGEQYRKLEAELTEKELMWKILKDEA
jgi:hypothetical protein